MHRPLLCGLDPIGSKPHSRGLCGGRGSCPQRTGERDWPNRASLPLRRLQRAPLRRRMSPRRPPSLPRRLQASSHQPSHPSPSLAHHRRPPSLAHHHCQPSSQPSRLHPRPANRHIWSGRLPHRLPSSRQPSSPHPTLSSLLIWSGCFLRLLNPFFPHPLCSLPNHLCFLPGRRCFAFPPLLPL